MPLFQDISDTYLHPNRDQGPQPSLMDMMVATAKAVDLLEGQPFRHGIRVATIAGSIARHLSLPIRDIIPIVFAGLLHDVGLAEIAMPMVSLLPQLAEGLTEKEVFRYHTLWGAKIIAPDTGLTPEIHQLLVHHPQAARWFVESVHVSSDVYRMIASSHELYDGTGYPEGLSGEQIPLGARILSFADTIECVMQTASGLSGRRGAVTSFLKVKAPGRFDPDVVAAFDALYQNEAHETDFIRKIYSRDLESMLYQLVPERRAPLTGPDLLDISRAMGSLVDKFCGYGAMSQPGRLATYAAHMAHHLGVSPEDNGRLIVAAHLQNLGMLAVPATILQKKDHLSPEERHLIDDHPRLSEEILKSVPGFEAIASWVLEHHERLNGSGYPCGKKGFELSVAGRLLAVLEVFCALTDKRPYRNHAHEALDAIPILGQGRHRLYDSQLLNALRSVVLTTELEPVS